MNVRLEIPYSGLQKDLTICSFRIILRKYEADVNLWLFNLTLMAHLNQHKIFET